MSSYRVEDNSIDGVQPLLKLLQHFFPYAQKQLGFHKPVMISFQSDEDNANKLLGRTGYYNPDEFSIAIYVDGRHPKDVLRSLSHELIHHTQNCNGEFDAMEDLGPGYAQENPAMREAELDAYKRGNIILRDFEDLIKKGEINVDIDFEELGEPRMSLKEWKNNELNRLMMKKWGLLKEDASISKAGRIDRTDIANKAPDEWIKEGMPRYRDDEGVPAPMGGDKTSSGGNIQMPLGSTHGSPFSHLVGDQLRKAADQEQAFEVGTDAMDKAITGTGPGTSVPPASAGRREDREHDDEEGNRPSMARKMDLDEQDEPDDKKKAGDRIASSGRDELGSGEVDLAGTDGVARWASEQPPHERFGRQPRHHMMSPKGMKESITLEEAQDLVERIFEKIRKETK